MAKINEFSKKSEMFQYKLESVVHEELSSKTIGAEKEKERRPILQRMSGTESRFRFEDRRVLPG